MNNFKNPIYEQWLLSEDKDAFVASLDEMQLSCLTNIDGHAWFRKQEYPLAEEFNDAWVKNDQAALDEYRNKCLAVKSKYPKYSE
tara:strand:- start:73 stop:327 length:255 start_codon:yes stop_codon:yes gene_type:complete